MFGFGWKNNAPEEVYLIPSTILYSYDINTGQIVFQNKIEEIRQNDFFKDYQVILNKDMGKCYIQYKKKQNNF